MTLIRTDHYLTKEQKKWLEDRHKEIGVKPSETIRRLIDAEIEREQAKMQAGRRKKK